MKLVTILSAGLLLSSMALAQQPPGGGGFGGFGGGGLVNSIARSKPLQEELKVDADQLEKLTAALTKAREETREFNQKLFSRDTSAEERTEITKKVKEINDKAVAGVLKPEQVKRMNQLENQQAGLGLFTRAETVKSLNLTDEQKEKIAAINKDLSNDRRELFAAGGAGGRPGGGRALDPEVLKKMEGLQKEALANVVKVLNDEQGKSYKEMVGEHFDLPANLAFGGFGGGGAPGTGGFPGGGGFGGGFGGGGQAGIVLTTNAQTQLKLTDEQKKELEVIQKDVDARLEKMLTEEQRTQLKEMRDRQPGRGTQPGRGGRTQPKKDN